MITRPLSPHESVRTVRFFAERGVGVFLCHPFKGGRCACGHLRCESPNRHPLTPEGPLAATTNVVDLVNQMEAYPESVPALLSGRSLPH
jgi:hypothetical protein